MVSSSLEWNVGNLFGRRGGGRSACTGVNRDSFCPPPGELAVDVGNFKELIKQLLYFHSDLLDREHSG